MKTIGVEELKTNLDRILDDLEDGEAVTITRRGVPVANMTPVAAVDSESRKRSAERLKNFPKATLPEGMTIRDLIDWGRKH